MATKDFKKGIIQYIREDMSNEDYQAVPALSNTGIKQLLKSGMHYDHWRRTITQPTEAMEFGTAFHTAFLEPDKFNDLIAIQPESIVTRRGKAWDEFESENRGKIILKKTHDKYGFNILMGMMESLDRSQHSTAKAILNLSDRHIERSIFWEYEPDLVLKARPDLDYPVFEMLCDLKSTQNGSQEGFGRLAANLGYDVQAAHYLAGINSVQEHYYRDFLFVLCEVEPPHAWAVRRATQDMLDAGRAKCRKAIERYKEYKRAETWPGYPDRVEDIAWPKWA